MNFFKKDPPEVDSLMKKIIDVARGLNYIIDRHGNLDSTITTDSEKTLRNIKIINDYIKGVKEYKNLCQELISVLNRLYPDDEKRITPIMKKIEFANSVLKELDEKYSNYSQDASTINTISLPKIEEAFGGRKRKTRKHRSRKVKKTRKH